MATFRTQYALPKFDIYKKDTHWVVVLEIKGDRCINSNEYHKRVLDQILDLFGQYSLLSKVNFHYRGEVITEPYYEGPVDMITFELPSSITKDRVQKMREEFNEGDL